MANSVEEMDKQLSDLIKQTTEAVDRLRKHANNVESFIKSIRKPTSWKNPNLYKTSLCDHWRNKKKCRYGAKCWYAHGTQDLRTATASSVGDSGHVVSSMDSGDSSSILDPIIFSSMPPPSTCVSGGGGGVDLTQKNAMNVIEMSSLLQNLPHPNFPPPTSYSNDVFSAFSSVLNLDDNYGGGGGGGGELTNPSTIVVADPQTKMTPSMVLNNKSNFEKSFRPFADSYPIKNILF